MTTATAILALGLPSTLAVLTVLTLLALASGMWTAHYENIALLAIIATCLQLLSLGAFITLLWRKTFHARNRSFSLHSSWKDAYFVSSLSLACLAGAASLAIIIWMESVGPYDFDPLFDAPPQNFLIGLVVSWVFSIVGEALTFALLILRKGLSQPATSSRSMDSHEVITFNISENSKAAIIETPPSSSATAASTPPLSPASPSLCSLQSITAFPSRTPSAKVYGCKSLRPASGSTELSEPDSITSLAGSAPTRNASYSNPRPIAPSLPTIPGSRPVSPARALDGPFADLEAQGEGSPLPLQPPTPTVISPGCSPSHDAFPLTPPQPPYLAASRPGLGSRYSFETDSLASDAQTPVHQHSHNASSTSLAESVSHLRRPTVTEEENIHPLFRTTSPSPPPAASQGTVVHAASVTDAEEVATSGAGTARRRANSRVGSPLSRPATATAEPPSIPGVMTGELHLKLQELRSKSQDSSPQASPRDDNKRAEADKESTPAPLDSDMPYEAAEDKVIPNFVLAARQPSCFLGFESWRASQRHKVDGAKTDESDSASSN